MTRAVFRGLATIIVRADQGEPRKSVGGLDFGGLIEGRPDAGSKNKVHLFDAATGRQMAVIPLQSIPLRLEFTPDGTRLVGVEIGLIYGAGLVGGSVQAWDAETGKRQIGPLKHGEDPGLQSAVSDFRIAPDGRSLVSLGVRDIRFWDLATGRLMGEPLAIEARDLAWSPDGQRLAVLAPGDGAVQVWDLATRQTVTPRLRQGTAAQFVRFSGDGRLVVTAGVSALDGAVEARGWDLTGVSGPAPRALAGRWLGDDGRSKVGARISRKRGEGGVVTTRRFLRVYGPDDEPVGQELEWAGSEPPRFVVVSANGRRVLAVPNGSAGRTLHVYDTADGRAQPIREHPNRIWRAALSPDGRYAAVAFGEAAEDAAEAWLWDLDAGTSRALALIPARPVGHLEFSPDSRRLVEMQAGNARLRDAATGDAVGPGSQAEVDGNWLRSRLFESATLFPGCAAFSADGRVLALTIGTREVNLIDPENGRHLPGSPLSAESRVHLVACDEAGRRIAAGLEDGNVRVFRRPEGRPVGPRASLDGAPLEALAMSPDGLVVLLYDGRRAVPIEVETGVPLSTPSPVGRIRRGFRFVGTWKVLVDTVSDGVVEWDFSPDTRPAQTLRALGEMVSGRAIDEYGQEGALPVGESAGVWAAARGREPEAPTGPAESPAVWHGRLATEAEEGSRYFAAAFHLGRLIDLAPDDPALRARRGEMRAELGDLAGAETDFAAAVAARPKDRASVLALALLRARLGDADGYAAACALIQDVERLPNSRVVEELSILGIRPELTRPLLEARLEGLQARGGEGASYGDLAALAVARLRLGQPEGAVQDLRRAIVAYGREQAQAPNPLARRDSAKPMEKADEVTPQRDEGTPRDWFTLALAERALGHEEAARAWGVKGTAWLDTARNKPDHPTVAGAFSEPLQRGVIRGLIGISGGSPRQGKRSADQIYYPSWREVTELELLRREFEGKTMADQAGRGEP